MRRSEPLRILINVASREEGWQFSLDPDRDPGVKSCAHDDLDTR